MCRLRMNGWMDGGKTWKVVWTRYAALIKKDVVEDYRLKMAAMQHFGWQQPFNFIGEEEDEAKKKRKKKKKEFK